MASNNISRKWCLCYFVTLCAVLSITSAEDNRLVIHLKTSTILQFRQLASECGAKTGVPAEYLKKMIDGALPNTKNVKIFLNCIVHNIGYIDENGHFNVDNTVGSVAHMVKGTKEEFAAVLNKCNEVTLENNLETTFAMGQCLHKRCVFTFTKPATKA